MSKKVTILTERGNVRPSPSDPKVTFWKSMERVIDFLSDTYMNSDEWKLYLRETQETMEGDEEVLILGFYLIGNEKIRKVFYLREVHQSDDRLDNFRPIQFQCYE